MTQEYELFSLMSRIEGMSNQFTKTDWKIVQFIKKNIIEFIDLSAQELAKSIGTSDASIIRFAQKVGFSGLNELKYTMQKELDKNAASINYSSLNHLLNDYKMLLDSLFTMTNPADIKQLVEKLKTARRIFVIGLDLNQSIAEIITHKMLLLGLTILPITNYETLKLYQSNSDSGDLFLAITLSGNHKVLSSIMGNVKKNESTIIVISNYEKSLCSAHADMTLIVPKTQMLKCKDMISREILILALIDMVFQNFLLEVPGAYDKYKNTLSYTKSRDDDTRDGIQKIMDLF